MQSVDKNNDVCLNPSGKDAHIKIKGVNLGNWLVLEKWMKPDLFADTIAEDESDLYAQLGLNEMAARLKVHRNTYVTAQTFQQPAAAGCNLVRIPVPYTIFGDVPGTIGCIAYLDKAMDWAEATNIGVLIDLHTVPGGQNGFDNSGTCGLCTWHLDSSNEVFTLDVLERLAYRYAGRRSLFGIEPMNEPANAFVYHMNMQRYSKQYPKRVAQSAMIPAETLRTFYEKVYARLCPVLGSGVALVFHDQFELDNWTDFMPAKQYQNVWMDTHMYLNFSESKMPDKKLSSYLALIETDFAKALSRAKKHHPVLVGEWSLGQHMHGMKELDASDRQRKYRILSDAQIAAWETAEGGIFWNFRNDAPGREDWDFFHSIENGWLSYQ